MKEYEELKELIRNFLSALDTEMELGDYHLNEDFITDEQIDEYHEAVDEVVSIRNKIEKIIS